jgi:phosphoribosylformylglycinamidine synthase subunit PurL
VLGETRGRPAMPDLAAEAALIGALWRHAPSVTLLHDADEGGLAVALAEAAIFSGLGAELDLAWDAVPLFGEGGGQAVAAVPSGAVAGLRAAGIPCREIGRVGGDALLGVPVIELAAVHARTLPAVLG